MIEVILAVVVGFIVWALLGSWLNRPLRGTLEDAIHWNTFAELVELGLDGSYVFLDGKDRSVVFRRHDEPSGETGLDVIVSGGTPAADLEARLQGWVAATGRRIQLEVGAAAVPDESLRITVRGPDAKQRECLEQLARALLRFLGVPEDEKLRFGFEGPRDEAGAAERMRQFRSRLRRPQSRTPEP